MATYDSSNAAQQALIDRVEYRADQVTASGQTIGLNRESVFDEMVEASRNVLRRVPNVFVLPASTDGSGSTAANVGSSHTEIELPDDFIRFLSVECDEWKRAVYDLTDPRTDLYRMQFNSRAQADIYNPVVALVSKSTATSGQALQCFPQDATPTIAALEYVGETDPSTMPPELVDPMLWETTGRALQAQKEDGAAAAYELAQQSISNLMIGQKGEEIPTQ